MKEVVTLNAETASGRVEDWSVIPDSFAVYTGANGRTLAEYDSLDTSRQEYDVSYALTDGTGNIQTVKVKVVIQAAGIVGTRENIENSAYKNSALRTYYELSDEDYDITVGYDDEGNIITEKIDSGIESVEAYGKSDGSSNIFAVSSASEGAFKKQLVKDYLTKLGLRSVLNVRYESGSTEKLTLGNVTLTGRALITGVNADGTFEVGGFIEISGDGGIGYTIPVMKHTGGTYEITLNIGTQGYSESEMNAVLTDLIERDVAVTNGIKARAFDELYSTSDRYTKILLDELVAQDKNPLDGENGKKAYAFDKWPERFTDPDSDYYTLIDSLALKTLLLKYRANAYALGANVLKAAAYDRIYSSGKISRNKLEELMAEFKPTTANDTACKARVWDEWYSVYVRSSIKFEREIVAQSVRQVESVVQTVSDKEAIDLVSIVKIYFESETEPQAKRIEWLNEQELIDRINAKVGYNGYITYGDFVLKDTLFGSQTVRQTVIQVNSVKIIGLIATEMTFGRKVASYNDETGRHYMQIDPYDEKSVDEVLGYYLYGVNHEDARTFAILVEEESNSAPSTIPYSIGVKGATPTHIWKLETRDDGRILWKYVEDTNMNNDYTDDGFGYDGRTATKIQVLVKSYDYDTAEEGSGKKWQQWVTIDFADMYYADSSDGTSYGKASIIKDATIEGIYIDEKAGNGMRIDGSSKGIKISYESAENLYNISFDPNEVSLEGVTEFDVVYRGMQSGEYATLVGKIDLSSNSDFYNVPYVYTTVVFGDKHNNIQTVKVRLNNTAIRRFTNSDNLSIKYAKITEHSVNKSEGYTVSRDAAGVWKIYKIQGVQRTEIATPFTYYENDREGTIEYTLKQDIDMNAYICSALEDINAVLPNYAFVEGEIGGKTEEVLLKVEWTYIETYGTDGKTASGNAPKAEIRLGDETFGYLRRNLTLNINREEIASYVGVMPSSVNVDPYSSTADENALIEKYREIKVRTYVYDKNNVDYREEVKTLSISIDTSNIDYANYRKNGFEEMSCDVYFKVGSTVNSIKNTFDVRYSNLVEANVLSRVIESVYARKKGSSDELSEITGDMYNRIDFTDYEYFVQYGSGKDMTTSKIDNVEWNGIDNVIYNAGGGTYTITATVGSGELAQRIELNVNVTKAQAIDLVYTGSDVRDDADGEKIVIEQGEMLNDDTITATQPCPFHRSFS